MDQRSRASDQPVAERTVGAKPLPLLTTKLYSRLVRPELERRPRLVRFLERNRHRPLALNSASAGYGEIMLTSLWLESCDCSTPWLSLDEADNDRPTFVSYLLAAVLSAFPTLELETQSLLDAPTVPRCRSWCTTCSTT